MLNSQTFSRIRARQRGASAVEFGIVAILFFTLFFGVIEFGRFFYLYNTVQEVTRCAARHAVVNWTDQWDNIRQQCLFGHDELVAGWEIRKANVRIRNLNVCDDPRTPKDEAVPANPGSATDNVAECGSGTSKCIRFVEASVVQSGCANDNSNCPLIQYSPIFELIPLKVNIPGSTMCMPAESLGYGM